MATDAPVPPRPAGEAQNILDPWRKRIQNLAGTEELEGFSLREMFSEVFQKRTEEEMDDYFIVGTYRTTPSIHEVQCGWPKPWFFMRVLFFIGIVYVAFSFAFRQFNNTNLIPGLIMMGSLAVPLATVFLFWELNTPRNVSLPHTLTMVCTGGIVSLIVSLQGFAVANLDWLGASQAGIVEEIGKLAAVIILVRNVRYRYILNGMLFGAAVGAGFAAFESAGYAFRALLSSRSADHMSDLIQLRAFLTPFGHVAWTALSAGALWRVKGDRRFNPSMLLNPQFLKAFTIPVGLHMLWNSPLSNAVPYYLLPLALGVIGWFVVFGLVQQGLRQVKTEQLAAANAGAATAS
jgi:RsiW-degrading membrane proteinase PrsW (M82 family)